MLFLIDLHLIWLAPGKIVSKKVFRESLDPIVHVKKIIAGPTVPVYWGVCNGTGSVAGPNKAGKR
mgnify:CR=1 FL=1